MTTAPVGGQAAMAGTIETRRSWLVAWSALGVLSISFGAPLITVVALKPIAAEFGNIRSVPALSYSLAWLGSAAGGIAMGLVAEQAGAASPETAEFSEAEEKVLQQIRSRFSKGEP